MTPDSAPLEEPITFDEEGLKRVQDIIRNARATWFALLGALVFASITLASVKDVSFFVNTVETKLPLVGISVPVVSFFWAGSLLIAALYAYFHLYLELLWQALGDTPARINGKPLADRIEPWIVADAALRLRDRLRGAHGEECASRKRTMQTVADITSFGLVWLFGLLVIGWFWWRSMPKHEPGFTLFIGMVFTATLWVFMSSLWSAWVNLADRELKWRWQPLFLLAGLAVLGATISRTGKAPEKEWANNYYFASLGTWAAAKIELRCRDTVDAEDPFFCLRNGEIANAILRPAQANLREVVFTEKPKDWQGRDIAEIEFRLQWCRERSEKCKNPFAPENRNFMGAEEEAFQAAWRERWRSMINSLPKPDLRNMDLRHADLTLAELEGIEITGTNLSDADLSEANLEYAILSKVGTHQDVAATKLERANLLGANLEGALLWGVDFSDATLTQANLRWADMTMAKLNSTDLSGALLSGATLDNANFDGAALDFAFLDDADLSYASFQGAALNGASLVGALVADISGLDSMLEDGSFSDVDVSASAFSSVDFSGADSALIKNFSLSFGDASVVLPADMEWPCHWGRKEEGELDTAEFNGRWRGWIEAIGYEGRTGVDLSKYPAVPPPKDCAIPLLTGR